MSPLPLGLYRKMKWLPRTVGGSRERNPEGFETLFNIFSRFPNVTRGLSKIKFRSVFGYILQRSNTQVCTQRYVFVLFVYIMLFVYFLYTYIAGFRFLQYRFLIYLCIPSLEKLNRTLNCTLHYLFAIWIVRQFFQTNNNFPPHLFQLFPKTYIINIIINIISPRTIFQYAQVSNEII